jgi:hypothetical protein
MRVSASPFFGACQWWTGAAARQHDRTNRDHVHAADSSRISGPLNASSRQSRRVSSGLSQHCFQLRLGEFHRLPSLLACATPSLPPGGHRRPTTPVFASASALSWVLLLAACDHASYSNELAWRRPRHGHTRDGARSSRRSVLMPRVFGAVLRLWHPNSWKILYADCQRQASRLTDCHEASQRRRASCVAHAAAASR